MDAEREPYPPPGSPAAAHFDPRWMHYHPRSPNASLEELDKLAGMFRLNGPVGRISIFDDDDEDDGTGPDEFDLCEAEPTEVASEHARD